MARQPSIFISHKHADRKIATELRKFLNQWSRKEIPVFQSSDPLAQGPQLGHALTAELKAALWNAGVVLLVYTTEDQDWSYCMWECGVATKPEAPQTRIIVLQCAAEAPKVFEDQVRVDVREAGDVLKFVQAFLTDPGFFPGGEAAVAPKLSPDGPEVQEAAADLRTKLNEVIPKREVAEWAAQPQVRLELSTADIDKAVGSAASKAGFETSVVVRDMDPRAWHVFGIAKADPRMSFGDLTKHWAQGKPGASAEWIEDLRMQVVRAAHCEIPAPLWTHVEEVDGPERYLPVLTRVRQLPALDALQFDISLMPLEGARGVAAMGDPYFGEYRSALQKVESSARALAPCFTPIAARYFNEWAGFVKGLIDESRPTKGPERLEITRLLVRMTKRHVLIEPVVSDPRAIHSLDWLSFYDEIGKQADVYKAWTLCVEESEARSHAPEVEAAWKFFKGLGFKTMYCSPTDLRRATGEAVLKDVVIEDFGEYVKLVVLTEGSYTSGEKPNELHTTFRAAKPEDRRLLQSMSACSTEISEDWLEGLLAASGSVARPAG